MNTQQLTPQNPYDQKVLQALHACNITDLQHPAQVPAQTPPPANTAPTSAAAFNQALNPQIAALQRDLINRLLFLQAQQATQPPLGAQTPSYNSNSTGISTPAGLQPVLNNPPEQNPPQAQSYNPLPQQAAETSVLSQLETENPGFFAENPGRSRLKTYLCENCGHLNKAELDEILALACALENQAVESFKLSLPTTQDPEQLRQQAISEANRQAINKLATTSARAKNSAIPYPRRFTREQIAAMSQQEFNENQPEIFAQYSKGLIK